MNITKLGHSCVLIQEGDLRALIDPGVWSAGKEGLKNLDAILITHEHPDHADIESIKIINNNNPEAKIFTNKGVGKLLSKNNIKFELLENGQSAKVKNVLIEAFGEKHAKIYDDLPVADDTGFMIAQKFFMPGDAFHIPPKRPEILALPVTAPWMKISEGLDYALQVKPKLAFPIHDGFMATTDFLYAHFQRVLPKHGIEFKVLEVGKEYEL